MRTLCTVAFATIAALSGPWALAQTYPAKPVTLVVPNPPGGFVDTSARLLAEPLGRLLGQPVIVDNKGGGSGNVAYQGVARSNPDGYTLLASYSAYHVGNPALSPKLLWSQKDLVPVALVTVATNVIAVNPAVPAKTLKEFIDYLHANPGKLTYASQGNGSLSHIGTEMFKQQTKTDMVHIPYKGSGPAVQDVLGNQVQVFITTPPSVMGHVQTGKLRALAIAGPSRHPMMPSVPTTAEAGLPDFRLEAWVGIFAPAGTSPDVVRKLTTSIKQALEQPEAKQNAATNGVELRYMTPEALGKLVQTDTEFWAKTIKEANIKGD
jgi:tripartite-type tricarboxylate transporter receptor subunit TctC